jgi:hypothetical protein
MAVRNTMLSLIARTRQLINDPNSVNQVFDDQTLQDVLDERRVDVINGFTEARPTFSGSSIQYLHYFAEPGNWEDDYVLKQYLTVLVTPASVEPIVGRFTFSNNVFPPVFITGKNYDCYGAAADLLERMQAKYVLAYSFIANGQNLQRGQISQNIALLVKQYRMKQRPRSIPMVRTDVNASTTQDLSLRATSLDYMASGNG